MKKVKILNKEKNKEIVFEFEDLGNNIYQYTTTDSKVIRFDYTQTKSLIDSVLDDCRVDIFKVLRKKYSLSDTTFFNNQKSKDPRFNLKLYLIYLDLKQKKDLINKEIELMENAIKSNKISVNQYSKLSNITKQTLYNLKNDKQNKDNKYFYKTYLKIVEANKYLKEP
ncbi:hypothetical protein FAD94_002962 [Enterococcus faecalis]|uniref:hypothetical protein n=1 Tax=Enterococcus faecalis TaxID=1351 RepID=UPI000CF106D6|nr:hypothetical protein [Enterococcus faecalis]EGO8127837.1 hypothetical protein [Enterococcus faecalis]MCU9757162.1 hypothetical protein [Enterococcus faecalis]MCU9774319.1 hypothetical protein [Enterococcus faecalis]MCU9790711.1 hypothetical protein [Enterococcus faecalis]PQC69493.1 hypothetical protein CUN08_10570 [Enterococcus faecalis]